MSKVKVKEQKPRTFRQSMVDFSKAFDMLARTQSAGCVFDDFLDFTLLQFFVEKPQEVIDSFNKKWTDERDKKLFAEMAMCFFEASAGDDGNGLIDPLGDFFMEHLSSDRNGQFFTPMEICNLMALITVVGTKDGQTVNDCACGSGRNLLASARINRNLIFFGEDLDLRCCKMTMLNMVVNNLQGVVTHQNTLSMQIFNRWEIVHFSHKGIKKGTCIRPVKIERDTKNL